MDHLTGLYPLRARMYEPSIGRFLSVDPLDGIEGVPYSHHDYIYSQNDPISLTDPTGMMTLLETLQTVVLKNTLFRVGLVQAGLGVALRQFTGSFKWEGPVYSLGVNDYSIGLQAFTYTDAAENKSATVGIVTFAKELIDGDSGSWSWKSSRGGKLASRPAAKARSYRETAGGFGKRGLDRQAADIFRQGAVRQQNIADSFLFDASNALNVTKGDATVFSPGLFGLSRVGFVGTFTSGGGSVDVSGFSSPGSGDALIGSASLGASLVNYGFSGGVSIPDTSVAAGVGKKKGNGFFDIGGSFSIQVGISLPLIFIGPEG